MGLSTMMERVTSGIFPGLAALPPLLVQCAGAVDVGDGDADDRGDAEGDAAFVVASAAEGIEERRQVYGVAGDTRPEPAGGPGLGEDSDSRRQLPESIEAQDGSRLGPVAHSDEGGYRPGREDFREPEANTEPPEALRQTSYGGESAAATER